MPPFPSASPGYQFWTVEYLIVRAVERHELDHRGVELVLVAHRRGAALEVGDVGALVRDDERPLELAGVLRVDPEVGGELHRAADALRHVDERAVGEDRAVERREVVVGVRARPSRATSRRGPGARAPPRRTSRRRCRGRRASSCRWSRPRPSRRPRPPRRRRGASAPRAGCPASGRRSAAPDRPRPSTRAPSSASARSSRRCPGSRSSGSGRSPRSAPAS